MMKRILVLVVGFMLCACCVAGAAEAVVESAVPVVWAPMVGQISQLAIEILGPALVALAIWALHKVSKKFGIEASASLEKRVRSLVRSAINHADAWAKTMAEKPAGSDKKAAAVKFVIAALAKTGVKDFAKTKIEELVEAQLEFDKKVMPAKKAE